MKTKKKKKNKRKSNRLKIKIATAILAIILGVVVYAISENSNSTNNRDNVAYFSYLNNRVVILDTNLAVNTKDKISYDQINDCYYWNHTELSNGPLGCTINRAYYFTADNESSALVIDQAITSAVYSAFPTSRYDNSDQQFAYDKNIFTANGVEDVGQPAAGFTDTAKLVDTKATQYQAYCSYEIYWPYNQYYGSIGNGLPVRHVSGEVIMQLFCGADASKAYYALSPN